MHNTVEPLAFSSRYFLSLRTEGLPENGCESRTGRYSVLLVNISVRLLIMTIPLRRPGQTHDRHHALPSVQRPCEGPVLALKSPWPAFDFGPIFVYGDSRFGISPSTAA
jgi:hypothetical protein